VTAETTATVHIYMTEEVRHRLAVVFGLLAKLGRHVRQAEQSTARDVLPDRTRDDNELE